MTLTDKIAALLAADPACNGRVTGDTVRAIAGLVPTVATAAMIEAGLTTGNRFGPDAMRNIWRKMYDAAIERGDFGAGE